MWLVRACLRATLFAALVLAAAGLEHPGGTVSRRLPVLPRFGDPEEAVEQAMTYVVVGGLMLRAALPDDKVEGMLAPLQSTLAKFAGVASNMVIVEGRNASNLTMREGFSEPFQDFDYEFLILPTSVVAIDVALAVAASDTPRRTGDLQPLLLQLRVAMTGLAEVSNLRWQVGDWYVRTPEPEVTVQIVWRPEWRRPSATTLSPMLPPTTTTGPLQLIHSCGLIPAVCQCVTAPDCIWAIGDGQGKCLQASEAQGASVSCTTCPTQAHCTASECAASDSPCSCANAAGLECRWDDGLSQCVDRGSSFTSCAACPTQPHCTSAPDIVSVLPAQGAVLQMPDDVWLRINFDRSVVFSSSASTGVALHCAGQLRPELVPTEQLALNLNTLSVSVQSILTFGGVDDNGVAKKCRLFLADGVVRDLSGIGYVGSISTSVYWFRLGDTVAPYVTEVFPANGASGAAVSDIKFTFNEPIFLGGSAAGMDATLSSLDSAELETSALISLRPPFVDVSGRQLTVKLGSKRLQEGVLYTLALPAASLVDSFGNAFAGLPTRTYAFRIGLAVVHGSEYPEGTGELAVLTGAAGLAFAGGSVALLIALAGLFVLRRRSARRSHGHRAKPSRVSPSPSYSTAPSREFSGVSDRRAFRQARFAEPVGGSASAPPKVSPPTLDSSWGSGTWSEAVRGGSTEKPSVQRASTTDFSSKQRSRRSCATFAPAGGNGDAMGGKAGARSRRSSAPPGPERSAPQPSGSDQPQAQAQRRSSSAHSADRGGSTRSKDPPTSPLRGSKVFVAATPVSKELSGVQRKKDDLEKRLRALMSKPLVERKRFLRELMLEYHPDKNPDACATEVFQFINASRAWFLADSP